MTELAVTAETGESKWAYPSRYYGVITANMTVPIALFISEKEATTWAAIRMAEVRRYSVSDGCLLALLQC